MKNEERIATAVKLLKESSGYYKNSLKFNVVSFDIRVEKKDNGRQEIYVFPIDKLEIAFYWPETISKIAEVLGFNFYLKIINEQINAVLYCV